MSNRLHQKNHRFNHHSLRLTAPRDPKYPDAGYDPIASFESPFQGEFYSQGNIITTQNLSATQNIITGQDALVNRDLNVVRDQFVGRNMVVGNNMTINGNFTVLGVGSQIDTFAYITSAVTITNDGTGPALSVTQSGFNKIAEFVDANGNDIVFADNGKIGMGTDTPLSDLHIMREVPAPVEIILQNVDANGGSVLNLAGVVRPTDGASLEFNNATGLTTLKNRFSSPGGPSFKFETQQGQAIAITLDKKVVIGPITNPPEVLTVVGNISATGNIFGQRISGNSVTTTNISAAAAEFGLIVNRIVTVPAQTTTLLSQSANDIELTAASNVIINSFTNGVRGATYTLTNVSTNTITITSSPTIFVRQGPSWGSNTQSLSTAFILLKPGQSCNARAAQTNIVSVW